MSTRIKLLLVIPTLDQSGAEKQLATLCTRLDPQQYDVQVICLTRGGHYEQMLREAGIRVSVLKKRFKFDPFTMWQLKREIRRFSPDVIHTWLFAANAYTRLVAPAKYRSRLIVSERCVDSWKAGWQLWLDRKQVSQTARLIGNSQAVVDFYRELGYRDDQLGCIHNGISLPEEISVEQKQTLRSEILAKHQLPEQARIVLSVSRLAEQKRIKDLIWAMQLLRQVDPRYHLLLLGDGPQKEELQDYARGCEVLKHCHFLGHQNPQRYFQVSDCYWLASEFEGLSNSLMEAMSYGLPCVVSEISSNCELIEHETNGLVAKLGESAEIAKQTRRLFEGTEPLAEGLGQAAQLRIAEEFSIERMVKAYTELYTQVHHASTA